MPVCRHLSAAKFFLQGLLYCLYIIASVLDDTHCILFDVVFIFTHAEQLLYQGKTESRLAHRGFGYHADFHTDGVALPHACH